MKNKLIFTILILSLLLSSSLTAKDLGPFVYTTVVATGYEEDTLLVPQLYSYVGNASVVGKYVWIQSATEAIDNQVCKILEHTVGTTGTLVLDNEVEGAGNDAVLGFTATITVGDILWIMDSPPVGSNVRAVVTATQPATGVADLNQMLYIANAADSADVVSESNRSALYGADGIVHGAITAAKIANSVNFAEGLLWNTNGIDTTAKWLNEAAGMNAWAGTATKPGTAGASFSEAIDYLGDVGDEIQDSIQSASQVRLQSITLAVTLTDADTTWFAAVTGETVAIARIEAIITTANEAVATDVQLVSIYFAGPVLTSMSADLDFTGIAIGSRVLWDLSNFGNPAAISTVGVPTPASDIFEEACEVPSGCQLGLETGELPDPNAIMNLTIWYYTNGTGIIAAP